MGYGFTFQVDSSGQVVYDSDRKDLGLVVDVEALKQDANHRLRTIRGEDPIHPTTGLPLLELFEDAFDFTFARNSFRDQLLLDLRIESVDSIKLGEIDANRRVTVDIKATAVDGETFTVQLLATVR